MLTDISNEVKETIGYFILVVTTLLMLYLIRRRNQKNARKSFTPTEWVEVFHYGSTHKPKSRGYGCSCITAEDPEKPCQFCEN